MKNKVLFSVACFMLYAATAFAGDVKLLKTEYQGASFNLNGAYVMVNVQVQASQVAEKECACFVLLKNERWDDSNITVRKLSKLMDELCLGSAAVTPTTESQTVELPMTIMLEQDRMTGKDSMLYMKTFLVDFTKETIVDQSEMMVFCPNTQQTRAQMMQKAGQMAGGLLGLFMGGGGSGGSGNGKTCPDCHGSGRCWNCNGSGNQYGNRCGICIGSDGKCKTCRGSGSVASSYSDNFGDEVLKQDDNKQNNKQEDSSGGLLDLLFGF